MYLYTYESDFVYKGIVVALFIIRTIAITAGSECINKVDSKTEEKHKEFQEEKQDE